MHFDVFRYSEQHVQSARRSAMRRAFLPALLPIIFLVFLVAARNWTFAAALGVVSIALAVRSLEEARAGVQAAEQMRQMEIRLSQQSLLFIGPDGTAEIALSSIPAVQIARRGGLIRAVAVNLPSADVAVIAGVDRLEEFAAKLRRSLGDAKVSEFRWWQPHPA